MRAAEENAGTVELPSDTAYFVLDDEDQIVHVASDLQDPMGDWAGHVLWDHLPEAESVYGPGFTEARSTGRAVESVVFYAGRVDRLIAIPAADGLAVHVEGLAELDVTNLGTLAQSLRRIEAALGARGLGQPGPPAPGSRRAPP
jgi:hypothetical protein